MYLQVSSPSAAAVLDSGSLYFALTLLELTNLTLISEILLPLPPFT